MSLGEVNAMDRAGFWRIADAALETAFAGRTFDEAIRDADRFTHLGYWSDGRKVTPPLISDNLSTIPRVNLPNGIRLIPWDAAVETRRVGPHRNRHADQVSRCISRVLPRSAPYRRRRECSLGSSCLVRDPIRRRDDQVTARRARGIMASHEDDAVGGIGLAFSLNPAGLIFRVHGGFARLAATLGCRR